VTLMQSPGEHAEKRPSSDGFPPCRGQQRTRQQGARQQQL